jgi:flagellar biosynthesis/type III secretory pathway protein FliH
MSAVIKSGDAAIAAKVRPIDHSAIQKPRGPAQVVPPETLALRRDIETLTRQLQQQTEEIDRLKAGVAQAFQDGEARGKAAGRQEATDQEEKRTSRLREGVALACARFDDSLASLERLSSLLALEGLQKLIGDPAHHRDLLIRTIRLNLDRLEANALVRVEVSLADFPGPLEAAGKAIGRGKLELRAVEELSAGQCRIRLRLGELDVGVAEQWAGLKGLLESLAEPEPPQ